MNKSLLKQSHENLKQKIRNRAIELGYDSSQIEPIYDGVFDIETYLKSSPKIMWILKEPYDYQDKADPIGGGFILFEGCNTLDKMHPIFKTLMYIIEGIKTGKKYNELPPLNESMLNALKGSAFINISKMPAWTASSNSHMKQVFNEWKDIIKDQIDLYNPEVIIFGNTFFLFENDQSSMFEVFQNAVWSEDASQPGITSVSKTSNGAILVDAYHPSKRRMCSHPEITEEVYADTIINGVRTLLR